MPVNGDRLGAVVDDCHGYIVPLVPDEMRSGSLTIEKPGSTSDAVGIACAIGDLKTASVKRILCDRKLTYCQSVLTKCGLDGREKCS